MMVVVQETEAVPLQTSVREAGSPSGPGLSGMDRLSVRRKETTLKSILSAQLQWESWARAERARLHKKGNAPSQ